MPGTSGVLLQIPQLQSLEERIAATLMEFASLSESNRNTWIAERLGAHYPSGLAFHEIARDLVSLEINSAEFSSTFCCPACGRLAIAASPERVSWLFFAPE